jgi:hypothetical protein
LYAATADGALMFDLSLMNVVTADARLVHTSTDENLDLL